MNDKERNSFKSAPVVRGMWLVCWRLGPAVTGVVVLCLVWSCVCGSAWTVSVG